MEVVHYTDFLSDIGLDWAGPTTIGIVVSIRQEGDKPAELTIKALLESTRTHRSIENQMHWRLDVGFKEDECRICREQVGENLAVIRHIALNLLMEEPSFKARIKRRQKKANRSNSCLEQILVRQGLRNLALHYLSPYSPNLNPIERLWIVMNEHSKNNVYFKSKREFREAIVNFYTVILPEIAGSLISRKNDNFQVLKPASSS